MSTQTDRFAAISNDVDSAAPQPEIPMRDITAHFSELARENSTMSTPTDEARELAKRWARNVAHGGGVDGLNGVECYRLFTWVRERVASEHAQAPQRGDDEFARTVAFELSLSDVQAWALIDAAKGSP